MIALVHRRFQRTTGSWRTPPQPRGETWLCRLSLEKTLHFPILFSDSQQEWMRPPFSHSLSGLAQSYAWGKERFSTQGYFLHSVPIVPIRYLSGGFPEGGALSFTLGIHDFNEIAFLILKLGKGTSEEVGEVREEKYKDVHFVWWLFKGEAALIWDSKGELLSARYRDERENVPKEREVQIHREEGEILQTNFICTIKSF